MISRLFVCFIVYGFLGWIYESIFCILHDKSWENRGFLYGPCIPLYGVGAVVAQILFVDAPLGKLQTSYFAIFMICAIGSFILEYGTSYVLEKKFIGLSQKHLYQIDKMTR